MEILKRERRLRRVLPVLLLVPLLLLIPSRFTGQEQEEYAVKAAFIFNFSKFVEWPPVSGSSAFGICILGDDPFDATIDQLTQGKNANGRPIQIRRLKEVSEAKACQIVFVSSSERNKAAKLIESVRGSAVLTVGETKEFLRMGGMIALSTEAGRVNIAINTDATQSGYLKVSAKLLTLATIYKSDWNLRK